MQSVDHTICNPASHFLTPTNPLLSSWHSTKFSYSVSRLARCVLAVLDHSSLAASKDQLAPFLVGHSFGGRVCMSAGAQQPDAVGGVVALDAVLRTIEPTDPRFRGPQNIGTVERYSATFADAVRRFRLTPPQRCDNGFLVRHIAERSVQHVEGKGWTFKFDRLWCAAPSNPIFTYPISHVRHHHATRFMSPISVTQHQGIQQG
jgi:pimeloyl-ACP methyl ester carboxylesterase